MLADAGIGKTVAQRDTVALVSASRERVVFGIKISEAVAFRSGDGSPFFGVCDTFGQKYPYMEILYGRFVSGVGRHIPDFSTGQYRRRYMHAHLQLPFALEIIDASPRAARDEQQGSGEKQEYGLELFHQYSGILGGVGIFQSIVATTPICNWGSLRSGTEL